MTGIWYLVTSFIWVCHIVGNVFGPVGFLLPVCWLSWFLYTLNIYAHFFVTFFSATIDGRNLIFDHKLHIGTPYRLKCFWIRQIPTSCLPKSRGIISELMLTVHLVQFVLLDVFANTTAEGKKLNLLLRKTSRFQIWLITLLYV